MMNIVIIWRLGNSTKASFVGPTNYLYNQVYSYWNFFCTPYATHVPEKGHVKCCFA